MLTNACLKALRTSNSMHLCNVSFLEMIPDGTVVPASLDIFISISVKKDSCNGLNKALLKLN